MLGDKSFEEKLKELKSVLSDDQLMYIHYHSVDNFLTYLNHFKTGGIKNQIVKYLEDYFNEIESKNYILSKDESDYIFQQYIIKIGTFYNSELNFKGYMRPKWALFIGLNIDVILLMFGLLKKIYYVPIVTMIMLIYFLYLKVFYEKKRKLYGLRY